MFYNLSHHKMIGNQCAPAKFAPKHIAYAHFESQMTICVSERRPIRDMTQGQLEAK